MRCQNGSDFLDLDIQIVKVRAKDMPRQAQESAKMEPGWPSWSKYGAKMAPNRSQKPIFKSIKKLSNFGSRLGPMVIEFKLEMGRYVGQQGQPKTYLPLLNHHFSAKAKLGKFSTYASQYVCSTSRKKSCFLVAYLLTKKKKNQYVCLLFYLFSHETTSILTEKTQLKRRNCKIRSEKTQKLGQKRRKKRRKSSVRRSQHKNLLKIKVKWQRRRTFEVSFEKDAAS